MKTSLQKFINELNSIDVNLNLYFNDGIYQNIIDSQFVSITERLDWFLRKKSKHSIAEKIQSSLSNISNIAGQIHFLSEFLSEEQKETGDEQNPVGQLKRMQLINKIASELQNSMVTTEINGFLSCFGVATENVDIVPSKRIYVQQLLKELDSEIVLQIAKELKVNNVDSGVIKHQLMQNLIKSNDLSSVMEDFNRATESIEQDPEQAVTSSSSTLESIFKAIIELEGLLLPKKKTMSVLWSQVSEIVSLKTNQKSDVEITRILSGIKNVILGVGALRTGYSTAHGHGIKKYKLSQRHVRLLVNSTITFGMFVLETYIEQKK